MDIPIFVETLGRSFFPMVRCLYIAIEFDTPSNQWSLGIAGRSFPFLMLGLTGVVQAPLGANGFNNPGIIDKFIDTVEDADGMVLFEDIWFPSKLFTDEVSEGTYIGSESIYSAMLSAFGMDDLTRRSFDSLQRSSADKWGSPKKRLWHFESGLPERSRERDVKAPKTRLSS